MSDNDKVSALVSSLVQALNASTLPLAVKELVLENIQLHIQVAKQGIQEGGEKDS